MEANEFHIGNLFHLAQVLAVAVAQSKVGAARSEHVLPEMRERMSRRSGVNHQNFRLAGRCLSTRRRGEQQQREQTQQKRDTVTLHDRNLLTFPM